MKVIYDKESDILDILFTDETVSESDAVGDSFIVDYSKDGKIVSIEILDASKNIGPDIM